MFVMLIIYNERFNMAIDKVEVLQSHTESGLERKINKCIEEEKAGGFTVSDIKYSTCSISSEAISNDLLIESFSALILFTDENEDFGDE